MKEARYEKSDLVLDVNHTVRFGNGAVGCYCSNESAAKTIVDALNTYEGLKSELTANKCLAPKTEADLAWNQGIDKALTFIEKYHEGRGLFQL